MDGAWRFFAARTLDVGSRNRVARHPGRYDGTTVRRAFPRLSIFPFFRRSTPHGGPRGRPGRPSRTPNDVFMPWFGVSARQTSQREGDAVGDRSLQAGVEVTTPASPVPLQTTPESEGRRL